MKFENGQMNMFAKKIALTDMSCCGPLHLLAMTKSTLMHSVDKIFDIQLVVCVMGNKKFELKRGQNIMFLVE